MWWNILCFILGVGVGVLLLAVMQVIDENDEINKDIKK